MASGAKKKSKGGISAVAAARGNVVAKRQVPWGTVIAVTAIVGLAAVVFGYYYIESAPQRELEQWREQIAERADEAEQFQQESEQDLTDFVPTEDSQDPSEQIDGVEIIEEGLGRGHIQPGQRVDYQQTPAVGGAHDGVWAACDGVVYRDPVRTEHLVHSLEHGAVWIAYDPDQLDDAQVEQLQLRVIGRNFTVMSPYPGLDKPISLQFWGHQLQVDNAGDERIDQFIVALRENPYVTPESGATCNSPGFEDDPPPFDAEPPGDDAVPMDFEGDTGIPEEPMTE